MHQKLQYAFCDKHLMKKHIIQHSSAHFTLGMMGKFGWEVLPHTSLSLDLVPFKYYLFKPLEDRTTGPALWKQWGSPENHAWVVTKYWNRLLLVRHFQAHAEIPALFWGFCWIIMDIPSNSRQYVFVHDPCHNIK
jgi:hypothetical protein